MLHVCKRMCERYPKKISFLRIERAKDDYTSGSTKPVLGCGAESQPLPFSPQQRGALR